VIVRKLSAVMSGRLTGSVAEMLLPSGSPGNSDARSVAGQARGFSPSRRHVLPPDQEFLKLRPELGADAGTAGPVPEAAP
jgi:hypothetical protein